MKFRILDTAIASLIIHTAASADAAGNPGVFNGPLTYTNSNPDVVKITPAADGLSVDCERVGPLGTAQITVTDGVVSDSFTVEVVASEATGIQFSAAATVAAASNTAAPAGAASTDTAAPVAPAGAAAAASATTASTTA